MSHNRQIDQTLVSLATDLTNCRRANYNAARVDDDLFTDPSLLDPMDEDHHDEIRSALHAMLNSAKKNGLPDKE